MFNLDYCLDLANVKKESLTSGLDLFVVQYEPDTYNCKLYFINRQKNCLHKYSGDTVTHQYFGDRTDNWRNDEPDYGSNLKKVADHLGISINPNHRVFIDVVEDDDYYINFQAAPREVALAVTRAVMVTYFIGTTEVLDTLNDINGTNWKTIEEALAVDGMLGIKIPFYPSKSTVKLYSKPFREKIGGNLEFDAATYSVLEQIYNDKFHSHRRLINEGLVLGKEPRTGRTVIYCARNGARSPR